MSFNLKKYPNLLSNSASELMDRFTESMHANIFVADKDGDIIYANTGAADTYQCSLDEVFTFNAFTMLEEGITDRLPAVREVLETKQAVKRYVKTGKDVGMIIGANPVFNNKGEVEYAIAISYKEQDFLDLISQTDAEKMQLQTVVSYLSSLQKKNVFLDSSNAKMRQLYELAQKAALSDSVVMIYGASGTGKEVMAKHIHSNSKRSNAPYIPINCAAIPSELMESEFFGYEKGSFTGASEKGKLGLFEVASSGTLFLDEIGELSLSMQSKLLRVLESGEFMRIGSSKVIKTKARIIGATNKELFKMVEEGTFRRDLYYRLNVIPLHLPTLKERPEDILPFAYHFLNQFNNKMGTKKVFSERTIKFFQSYAWPGNIRELRNMIERMIVISDSTIIDINKDYEPHSIMPANYEIAGDSSLQNNLQSEQEITKPGLQIDYTLPFKEALRNFEQDYVNHVLERCNGNVSKAAKELGLHRSSLYNILNR